MLIFTQNDEVSLLELTIHSISITLVACITITVNLNVFFFYVISIPAFTMFGELITIEVYQSICLKLQVELDHSCLVYRPIRFEQSFYLLWLLNSKTNPKGSKILSNFKSIESLAVVISIYLYSNLPIYFLNLIPKFFKIPKFHVLVQLDKTSCRRRNCRCFSFPTKTSPT